MTTPYPIIQSSSTDPLSDFRALVDRYPDAAHGDPHELAHILGCSEFEVAEAQKWMLEDGLEVRA